MSLDKSEVVDSRDIIARIEELEAELQAVHEDATEEGLTTLNYSDWLAAFAASLDGDDTIDLTTYEAITESLEELAELKALTNEAESSLDWVYGEALIREDYFTDYIEELIEDCYQLPEGFNSGEWPWRHMSLNYEAAAEEAKQDYFEVQWGDETYLIRA